MDTVWQDVRFAVRSLAKKPSFTFVVILTLALGIGANTAIFSFVNVLLLSPLPYQDAERLVRVQSQRGNETGMLSVLEIVDLKEQAKLFDGFASFRNTQYNITGNGPPEALRAAVVNWNLFDLLGVKPVLGAAWPETHERAMVFGMMMSYDLWQRRFGGNPNIVGQKIMLDAAPFYTIYGVPPPNFNFPANTQLFRSIAISKNLPNYEERDKRNVYAVARLKPGINVEATRAELSAFSQRLATTYPDINKGLTFALKPLRDLTVGEGYARTLGLTVGKARLWAFAATAALAGVVTAYCGPVVFLGVAIPHLARGLFNNSDHRVLMPAFILIGAMLGLAADLVTHLDWGFHVFHLNTVNALVGAPIVLWVILRRKNMRSLEL